MKIEERIADLEELIKTKEFMVNDAKWTLEHVPGEIEVLKSKLKELSQAGKAEIKCAGLVKQPAIRDTRAGGVRKFDRDGSSDSRQSLRASGHESGRQSDKDAPAPDSETTYQKAGEAGKLGSLHALSPHSSFVKKNGPPAPLEDE